MKFGNTLTSRDLVLTCLWHSCVMGIPCLSAHYGFRSLLQLFKYPFFKTNGLAFFFCKCVFVRYWRVYECSLKWKKPDCLWFMVLFSSLCLLGIFCTYHPPIVTISPCMAVVVQGMHPSQYLYIACVVPESLCRQRKLRLCIYLFVPRHKSAM